MGSVALKTLEVAKSLGHVVQYYLGDEIYAHASDPFHFEITQRYGSLTGIKHIYVKDNYEQCLKLGLPSKLLVMCGENGLEETMKKLTETHTHGDNVYLTQNATGWFVEVLSTNKGEGFVRLCKELNMDVTESIAFGDGHNDKEFIISAGLGVAMKNAVDQIKSVADMESQWTNDEVC